MVFKLFGFAALIVVLIVAAKLFATNWNLEENDEHDPTNPD